MDARTSILIEVNYMHGPHKDKAGSSDHDIESETVSAT